jgi:hypothetical protein
MALDIDGFAVLHSIAAHRRMFPDVATEVAKAARTLVIKQVKAKNTGLHSVRDIRKAIGAGTFDLIMDGMTDAQVKSLVTKLDKNHPELKSSTSQWRRHQLKGLAEGSTEPAPKVPKAKSPPKQKTKSPLKQKTKKRVSEPSEAGGLLDFKSAGATRRRIA